MSNFSFTRWEWKGSAFQTEGAKGAEAGGGRQAQVSLEGRADHDARIGAEGVAGWTGAGCERGRGWTFWDKREPPGGSIQAVTRQQEGLVVPRGRDAGGRAWSQRDQLIALSSSHL